MNMKPIVNNEELYHSLMEYLQLRINKYAKQIARESDDVQIRRLQGRILELEELKKVREEVNGPVGITVRK